MNQTLQIGTYANRPYTIVTYAPIGTYATGHTPAVNPAAKYWKAR